MVLSVLRRWRSRRPCGSAYQTCCRPGVLTSGNLIGVCVFARHRVERFKPGQDAGRIRHFDKAWAPLAVGHDRPDLDALSRHGHARRSSHTPPRWPWPWIRAKNRLKQRGRAHEITQRKVRPVGRTFAGRWLGVALATAGQLGLSLTSCTAMASTPPTSGETFDTSRPGDARTSAA